MESIAREKKDRKAIDQLMQEITAIFEKAEPVIKQKMESV
jgi:hypothetical protein